MRFLIVKTSAFGDIIHTFCVISYLRSRFPKPEHQIDWVVEKPFSDLVKAHPEIDKMIVMNSKEWRRGKSLSEIKGFREELRTHEYDAVFDLQGNFKSVFATFQARSKHKVGFDWKSVSEWPAPLFTHHRFNPKEKQNIREDYLSIVKQYFKDETKMSIDEIVQLIISKEQLMIVQEVLSTSMLQKGPPVMVCPGSAWKNKQLPFDSLINLLQNLQKKMGCVFLFIWGNEEEKRYTSDLQKHFHDHAMIVDRMPLPALQNLMMHMNLIVSMDSLPLHLAGTAGTPTLSVFGPSCMEKYCPKGEQHFGYQGKCPYGKVFSKRCKVLRSCTDAPCMHQLTGDEVFSEYTRTH